MDEDSQSVTLARGDQQNEGQKLQQATGEAQEGGEVKLPDEHGDHAPTESTSDTQDDSTRPE